MYKPPFEINDKIINLSIEITKKITNLETENIKKKILLRKASKIKSVNSTCAIEQNTLSENDVIAVIDKKFVIAPRKEILEIENAFLMYEKIDEFNPYSVVSFLSAHKILTKGLVRESGIFRSGDVAVYDNDKVIHLGARPEFVSNLVEELFDWLKNSELNPLIKSAIVHFELEIIHPFSDGNGRIGRFWQALILYKYNRIFEYVPIETLIYSHQQIYYNTIALCSKSGTSTLFIEFMLEMILKTINNVNTNDTINKMYFKGLTKTEKEISLVLVKYFENNETINVEEAIDLLGKNKDNVRKYFLSLVKKNILIPSGATKVRVYYLNIEVLNKD
ncbi:MAG: Fic family protein [bacterium]